MPKDQLTARQKQFCQLYAGEARHNAALAARLAGYAAGSSHVTGCQLLQKPKIAAALRAVEAANAQTLDMTRQQVMAELLEAAALAKLQAQPMALVRAWKAIAQAAGLDKPEKAEEAGASGKAYRASGDALQQLERMTDAELQAIVSAAG